MNDNVKRSRAWMAGYHFMRAIEVIASLVVFFCAIFAISNRQYDAATSYMLVAFWLRWKRPRN